MLQEIEMIKEEVKSLKEQVARLTDQVKDQIEINDFLRKMNSELNEKNKDKEWWRKIKSPRF